MVLLIRSCHARIFEFMVTHTILRNGLCRNVLYLTHVFTVPRQPVIGNTSLLIRT